jgi:predicted metal-dependent hydrolase
MLPGVAETARVPEPALDAQERSLFLKGVAEFNSGYYFECHDTLEELWAGIRGPSRDFFQGLIQVSVALYHLGGGNLAGAHSMIERALRRFAPYPDQYFGFDLGAQRRQLEAWREAIARAQPPAVEGEGRPRWRFEAEAG